MSNLLDLSMHLQKLEHAQDLLLPRYATEGSAGMDLMAAIHDNVCVRPGSYTLIPTGICIALPENYEAQIRPRSGLAAKHGVTVLNTPGTIDSDYRGEIKVILINHGAEDFVVERGMRIAQMVIAKYTQIQIQEVSELSSTDRGDKGFGSTGRS
ncbi:MAG: dUTP diphosphatase [Pseudomonadota bacterium]